MKLLKNLISEIGLLAFSIFAMTFSFSCCKEDDLEKWVDLRYRVEDSYTVEAQNPEVISFQVKSSNAWQVFGKEDWYTISPNEGESGQTYTVSIVCRNNTSLDDRTDTIKIKSDYWIGKQFTILQKGIAYLTSEGTNFVINKNGEEKSFQVKANQKWSAKVTEGDTWLTIVSETSGEMDGSVTISATNNKGEKRVGKVTLYDRYGVARHIVDCVQDGITLSPQNPENGKWFALEADEQLFKIAVEADVEWDAIKENEEDEWFEIDSSTTKEQLVLKVNEHKGTQVRVGSVYLISKSAEGTDPVRKEIKIKQINPPYTITTQVGREIKSGSGYSVQNMSHGKYLFYLKPPMTADDLMFMVQWKWGPETTNYCNVQYHLQKGVAKGMTSPWNNLFNLSNSGGALNYYRTLDTTKDHVMGFTIEENADVYPSIGNVIWHVDDEIVGNMKKTSGFLYNPNEMYWSRISTPDGVLTITCNGAGSAFIEKYEFIPPLDWGE